MRALRRQKARRPYKAPAQDYKSNSRRCSDKKDPGKELRRSKDLCIQWEQLLRWSTAFPILKPAPKAPGVILFHSRHHSTLLFSDGSLKPKHQSQNPDPIYYWPVRLTYHFFVELKWEFARQV